MFGNVLRVSGVTERLSQAAQNEMANIVTILLGFSISAAMTGEKFVNLGTLAIIGMGLIAFVLDTAGGVITAKILNLFLPKDKKVNPMVGAAGISAFPMSARVIQRLGQEADPGNHLLMHGRRRERRGPDRLRPRRRHPARLPRLVLYRALLSISGALIFHYHKSFDIMSLNLSAALYLFQTPKKLNRGGTIWNSAQTWKCFRTNAKNYLFLT